MPPHRKIRAKSGRGVARGIALITVLWLLALLTLLATTLVSVSMTGRRVLAQQEQRVQADLAADSGIQLLLLRLIEGPEGSVVPDSPIQLLFAGLPVEVTVEQEAGRIDLNDADPQLLVALLAGDGWEADRARETVDRILAWRGTEGTRRFESLDELRQIPGSERFTPAILDALTVFSHAPLPLQATSVVAVQHALAWADARQLGGHGWLAATQRVADQSTEAVSLMGQVLRVRACVRVRSLVHCRRTVVRPTGSEDRPFQVFEWADELP